MRKELRVAAANPAILLADVKVYVYAQNTERDDELTKFIPVAISQVENYTGRALVNQQFDIWFDRVEFFQMLQNGFSYLDTLNVISIEAIKTYDIDGSETIVDASTYRLADNKAKFDQTIPSQPSREMDAVKIEVTAGYGVDDTEVPDALKTAMYALISTWYSTNGNLSEGELSHIPDTVKTWLMPYRSTMYWFN